MSDFERLLAGVRRGSRFLVASHQRPDGDAVGSAVGMALALTALGKTAEVVMDAPVPHFLQPFPAVDRIRVTREVSTPTDGALIMECSTLARTGVAGLDRSPVFNIDHHPGNTRYGTVNWIDESAAACGEMVFTIVEALGVALTPDIATHLYLAVLTDTGSFNFQNITPRTFEIARRCVEAGADPRWIAHTHYNSNSIARVKVFGAVLNAMRLDPSGRVALLTLTADAADAAGAGADDTEGLINFPLTVKDIQAVAFFKQTGPDAWRVSLRSKGAVDIGAVARAYGGGGHVNAAGCSASGDVSRLHETFMRLLVEKIEAAPSAPATAGDDR